MIGKRARLWLFIGGLSLCPSYALACLNSGDSQPDYTELCPTVSNCIRVNHADLVERAVHKREEEMRQILQDALDVRQAKTELPTDDPDRFVDPDRNGLFWSDDRGDRTVALASRTHLTSRPANVSVVWDGRVFQLSWSCT